MMGRQDRDQGQLFYEFSLDEMIPTDHLLRRINGFATAVLADLHEQLNRFYSEIGWPSVDPELMVRMLLVGYCYGIRHERRLCQEVALLRRFSARPGRKRMTTSCARWRSPARVRERSECRWIVLRPRFARVLAGLRLS